MDFSSRAPRLKLLTGVVATISSAQHLTARGKGGRARFVRRYLDKADKSSTSNMHKHAKICWGTEIVSKALQTKNELTIKEVQKSLSEAKLQDGTITALFERKGKETVSFSMKQHTYLETRSVYLIITI